MLPSTWGYFSLVGNSMVVRNWFFQKTGSQKSGRADMYFEGTVGEGFWFFWHGILMMVMVKDDWRIWNIGSAEVEMVEMDNLLGLYKLQREIFYMFYTQNHISWRYINCCSWSDLGLNHAEAVPIRKLKKSWHSSNIVMTNQRLGVYSQKTTSQPFRCVELRRIAYDG